MDINDDLLIAGALLHDVSKMVEQSPAEGKPGVDSRIGEELMHGSYGAHLALNAGLPLDIINIISVHSPKIKKIPHNVEGIFICYADLAAFDAVFLGKDRELYLEKIG